MAFLQKEKIFNAYGTIEDLKNPKQFEKEDQSWRPHTLWFETILPSYTKQNAMVLA